MKRLKKNSDGDRGTRLDPDDTVVRDPDWKFGSVFGSIRLMGIFLVVLMLFSVLFSVSVVFRDPPEDGVSAPNGARIFVEKSEKVPEVEDYSFHSADLQKELIGGLLSAEFDRRSCLSRYQSAAYHKQLFDKPSSYLISRLRRYEALHKRCGPHTDAYNKTLEKLKSGHQTESSLDCNYVVWISFSGLGNRIVTLASAFLYALLTNRVLLVDPGVDMVDLFCDPFPGTSWFLPSDFPIKNQFDSFDQNSPHCYGKLVKSSNLVNSSSPSLMYVHLVHDYDYHDKLFFCDDDQTFLQKVPWLIMKTDNYFVPSLFLIPSFEHELLNLFPNKETVFHFLGRYLFHPTNHVWGLIMRYYHAYLSKADEKIGIQIRVFDTGVGPFDYVLDQIRSCISKEKILPDIDKQNSIILRYKTHNPKSKAVLVTSLSSGYFEKLRDIYWENPSLTGDVISVYQPSHEEHQQTEKRMHNRKAWAEMYLLSLSDKLVTSAWSTFGYVAQGLGGLRPWILYKPENRTAPDPPCGRVMSVDPCFHAPPFYDCKAKRGIDTGKLVPHVRHCEDMSWGLKLVDDKKEI